MKKIVFIFSFLTITFFLSCTKDVTNRGGNKKQQNNNAWDKAIAMSIDCLSMHKVDTPYDPTGCGYADVNQAQPNSFSQNDIDEGHNFRDNYLMNLPLGRDYINYFYELGSYAHAHSLIEQNPIFYYNLLRKGLDVASVLMNGNDNEVIIDTATYDYLESCLSTFRSQCNSNEINTILDKLENDLNQNKGKTKTEVITFLSSCE